MKAGGSYQVQGVVDNYIFNGQPITASVLQATNGSPENSQYAKEFIRSRVNSDNAPTEIDYFDNLDEYRASNIQSQALATITGRYGYECYVPRRITLNNQRLQGRYMVYNVQNNNAESFTIANIGILYKVLK
jgi:hypothetical protein